MIIIGYQGIGKSSISGRNSGRIDLESGNFWNNDTRPNDWYVYYCNIAEHLSKQKFTVFTSSHKEVRERLKFSNENIWVIYPSLYLKDQWIKRLEERYNKTNLLKDYKALKNAETMFEYNINDLAQSPFKHCEIGTIDYNLSDLVCSLEFDRRYGGLNLC